jgi:two-component system cell cycle response regulator
MIEGSPSEPGGRTQGEVPLPSAADKRTAPRRRALKAGIVAFNHHCSTFPCAVRDLSATGARLRIENPLTLPKTFELIVELDGIEVDCEVVWRKPTEVGVRFLGPPRTTTHKRTQVVRATGPESGVSLWRRPTLTEPH